MPFAELDGAATSYTDSGITADRYYTYVLYAVDSDGTMSEGAMAGSRPAAAPDTTAPSVPGGLLAKLFGSEVTLTWNRSTDNVAVTNYIITCNGAEIGRSYNRRFVQSGLMPGVQCSYTVSAIDGAGNRSAESTPVTVSVPDVSGITAASLTYDKNKAGCITGTALHINARTTADIASAQAVVEFTDTDGASDSLTVSLSAGKNGLKVGTVSLPYDFMTVERVTLTAYKTGVSDPADTKELIDAAITRANAFTVTLTNAKGLELPDLMKSVTVTVANGSGTYSASRKIADFAGHVTLFAPAAEGNTVIITSDGGDTLCTKRGVSIPAAGGSLTVDAQEAAGMVRLRLFETNGSLTDYTGVQVTARIKDRTVTGTADADGYVVWPSGHNLLVVDRDACEYDSDGTPRVTFSVAAQEVRRTDRVVSLNAASETKSLPDLVNDVRLSFGSAVLRLRTATAYVKDKKGRPVKGVTMRFSGKTTAAAVTDENGVARAQVQVYDYGRNMTGPVVVKLDSKMATDGRRWDWGYISYAEQADDYVCRPILTQISSLSISPVIKVMENGVVVPLDESAAADASLAMLVNGTEFYPNGGRWEKRSLTFTDGEAVNIRLTATLGDKIWRSSASLTYDGYSADVAPELVLYGDVTAKLTLNSSNKGLLPGVERRFMVFDANEYKLSDVKTYASSVNVSLPYDEKIFIVATFDTKSNYSLYEWKNDFAYTAVQEVTVIGDGEQLNFLAIYDTLTRNKLFWQENGFTNTPSQYRLDNGDWQVSCGYKFWNTMEMTGKTDYIVLPDGAYDVDIGNNSTYNAEEHTITIRQRYGLNRFGFKISAEKLKANPKLVSWFECKTSNNEDYVSEPRTLALRDSSVTLYGVAGAYYDELTETGGYQLTVDSQMYGDNCTLTVYDGDTPVLCQRMPSQTATVDIPLLKDIGSHTLRAVVSNGTREDSAEKTVRVTYEKDPLIVSAYVIVNDSVVDLLRSHNKTYRHWDVETVSAQVEVRNDGRIENIWIETHAGSDTTKIPLTKRDGTEGTYFGCGVAGSPSIPVTSMSIHYTLKDEDENGSYYELRRVVGSLSFDDVTYIERESSKDAEPRYEIVSAENNASQTKALTDWERYCELVNNSDSMTYSEFIDGLVDIYGDDDEWSLPAIKEKSRSTAGQPSTETVVGTTSYGGSGITCRMTYRKNSERAEAFLNSDRAISVLIDGEERRVGAEIVMGQTGAEIRFYGINDLFYFPVPDDEETVSADGNFWEYLWHPKANPKVKRPPGTAAERKQAAKELEKKLNDKLTETAFNIDSAQGLFGGDDDGPDGSDNSPTGPNDPCSSDTGKSKQSQDAHDQIDKRYDAAWNFIQTTGNATATTLGMMGAADFTSDALLDDDGVGHQLVDLMRQHEHDIQDVLDEIDDDSPGSPTSSDPCDPPTPKPPTPPTNPPTNPTPLFPLTDPSGIIHEAVADAPVQGVTASIYYKDDTSGEWVPWDSETYDQPSNPMLSLDNGYYGWDVLTGKWKVVFEKDGYFLAESEELDVPPAHTDVNISLVSSTAPTVTGLTAKADGGSVTLTFDKYMLTEDILRDGAVTVLLGDTVPTGTLAAVDPKTTAAGNKQAASVHDVTGGDEVAKQFIYTFDDPLPQGATVKVTVSDEAAAYNGMTLTEPFDGSVVIPDSDPIVYATTMTFEESDTLYKTVGDTFSIGKPVFDGEQPGKITYESNNPDVATVDADGNVTLVGAGDVTIWAYCDTLETGRAIVVTRLPSIPDENDNAVGFCRADNLILHKGCWMWSDGANFRLTDPIEGDGKYMAVSWRILENGTEKAGATLAEGEVSVKEHYVPTETGTLTGEITYQYYTYHEGEWVAVEGKTYTATKDMNVVTVTGLSVNTPPATVGIGDTLNLSELVLNVHTSDGLVSEVPYAKFYRWGMTTSTADGATLTKSDRVLTVTHPDSGSTVDMELWASTEHGITVTNDGNGAATASVEKADPGDSVTLIATPNEHYRLKEWQVVNGDITIENDQFTMHDTAVSVKAIFEPDHTLTHFAAVAATCETDGSIEYWHCDGCDKYFSDADAQSEITKNDIPIAAFGHDWDDGAVTAEPTCDKDGTKVYTCRHDASHTKSETVPALGHDLTLVPAVAATCETDGHSAYYECQRCGKLFADGTAVIEITDPAGLTIEALGHDWSAWTTITPASENTAGLERRVCSHDPTHEETRVLPKLPHSHVLTKTDAVPATCEENGHIAYWTCDGCGRIFSDADGNTEIQKEDTVVGKLGHDWDDGVVTTEPTCTEDGVKTFTCRHDASHTKTEPVARLGHKLKLVPTVSATCETDGRKAHYDCERCDRHFTDAAGSEEITDLDTLVIPATGHSYGSPIWTWTADHKAILTLTCSHDAAHTQTIPAIVTDKTTAPACESDGEILYNALVTFDGVTYTDSKTETVPATGHQLTLTAAVEPTCEKNGSKAYYVCKHCGKWYADATATVEITDKSSVVISALGHDYSNPHWTWRDDGTATVSFTCRHDDSHVQTVTATVTSEKTEPTCLHNGRILYTATAMFEERTYTNTSTVKLSALGHELHLIPAVAPTCEKGGNIAYYLCAHCNKLFADAEGKTQIQLEDTILPAKQHDWNGGVVTTEPTCNEDGVKTFTCLNDPTHTKTEAVPALGHSLTRVDEIPATCETEGRAAYYVCDRCGKYFADATGIVEMTDLSVLTLPALGHSYGEPLWHWSDADAATAVFTCTHDASHKESVTATVTTDKSEASCEKDGKLTYTAAVIFEGKSYTDSKTVKVGAIGHKLRHVEAIPATCETDGHSEHWICTQCGKYFADESGTTEISADDVIVEKLGHDWDDGVVTTAPTCEADGVKTFTCKHDAAHTRTEFILATGHKLHYVAAVKPTCETDGSISYYECETCGKQFADGTAAIAITGDITIPALGHDWGMWLVTKPATENAEGLEVRICQNDPSHTESRAIPALSHMHKLTKTEAIAATCEADGHIAYWTCAGCGRLFADAEAKTEINREDTLLKKLGHDWDGGVVTTEPTCTEDGVKTFTCKHDASHTFTESISALGHKLRFIVAIEPTCENDGHRAFYECETCGALFEDAAAKTAIDYADTLIPATGHAYGEPVWTWDGDSATATFTCTHDASHTTNVTASIDRETVQATCEADGQTVYTATVDFDGKTYADSKTEVLPATGHDWDEGVMTSAPNCEQDGAKVYTCRHDASHTKTEGIPALGHKLTLVPAVAATCETDGHSAYYECETCGKLFADGMAVVEITAPASVVIPALGHDWGEWTVLKEATVDEDGLKERICRHNTVHRQSERIPAWKAVSYLFVSDDGNTFVKGESATFTVKREVNDDTTFSRFLGIKIDGQTVSPDDYTAKPGSVVITLRPGYVQTLSVGEHTITVLFNDGSTTGSFMIEDTAPTSATTAPTSATTAPTSATTAPTSATTAPTSATTTPTSATTAPTSATTAPTSATTTPTSATTTPTSVNKSDSPKTGDDTNTGLWLVMTIGSLAIAMAIVLSRRKKYVG